MPCIKWIGMSPLYICVLWHVSTHFSGSIVTVAPESEDTECTSALTYTEQYCLPTSTEWRCLRQRALAQDEEKCRIYRNTSSTPILAHCAHAEICVFSVTKDLLSCDDRHINTDTDRCVRGTGDNFTCTIKGETFETPCHRSLVHCPAGEHLGACTNLHSLATILDDQKICYKEYEEILGKDTVWLFVDQALFNGTAYDYADVTVLRDDRQCPIAVPFRWEWLLAIPVLIVSFVFIAIYLRKKWRSYTQFGDPTEYSDDPIAREIFKALAVGDSMEMDLSQTTSEVVEPFGTLVISAHLPEAAGGDTEAPVEHRPIINGARDRGAEENSHASETELLNFIANSPCISAQAVALGLEERDVDNLGPLTPSGGDSSRRTSGFAIKSPLMSSSSAGSGFDASRPGGIGAIVPSSARNVYTNDAMEQGDFGDPHSSASAPIYLNIKPVAVHDYANDSVLQDQAAKKVSVTPSAGDSSGYFNKSTGSPSDCAELSVEALTIMRVEHSEGELRQNFFQKEDQSGLKEESHKIVTGQDAIHLYNPTYVYFRPNGPDADG